MLATAQTMLDASQKRNWTKCDCWQQRDAAHTPPMSLLEATEITEKSHVLEARNSEGVIVFSFTTHHLHTHTTLLIWCSWWDKVERWEHCVMSVFFALSDKLRTDWHCFNVTRKIIDGWKH